MYNFSNKPKDGKSFPNPLAPAEEKESREYGLSYAKAIESQWGSVNDSSSVFKKRYDVFNKNRKYANGTQDVSIYKKLLTSLDPNGNDGTLLNLDFTPVPILPKFVRIVANNILSKSPHPNVEAIDPLSSSYKDVEKKKVEAEVAAKAQLAQLQQKTGMIVTRDVGEIPDTLEEAEIFMGTNIKTDAEIAAQVATNMTMEWNEFNDTTFRRCVQDLVTCGMAVTKRSNDPNYGIKVDYVDPLNFVHSHTEDPNFSDVVYGGHVKKIAIHELKRIAGDDLSEDQYQKIASKFAGKYGNDSSRMNRRVRNEMSGTMAYGYDDYLVDVLEFEFLTVDCIFFEEKESRFGNTGFYFKGSSYKQRPGSVFDRKPVKMDVTTVYGGSYVLGCGFLFNYGKKKNIPKNAHDICVCSKPSRHDA